MEISDVFKFGDGRTVFVGDVEGSPGLVERVECELLVDGDVHQPVLIDGEEMPERRQNINPRKRAVGTSDDIGITLDFLQAHRCRLQQRLA
jgi:hypothetical protein